jgi:hypothetical protein
MAGPGRCGRLRAVRLPSKPWTDRAVRLRVHNHNSGTNSGQAPTRPRRAPGSWEFCGSGKSVETVIPRDRRRRRYNLRETICRALIRDLTRSLRTDRRLYSCRNVPSAGRVCRSPVFGGSRDRPTSVCGGASVLRSGCNEVRSTHSALAGSGDPIDRRGAAAVRRASARRPWTRVAARSRGGDGRRGLRPVGRLRCGGAARGTGLARSEGRRSGRRDGATGLRLRRVPGRRPVRTRAVILLRHRTRPLAGSHSALGRRARSRADAGRTTPVGHRARGADRTPQTPRLTPQLIRPARGRMTSLLLRRRFR